MSSSISSSSTPPITPAVTVRGTITFSVGEEEASESCCEKSSNYIFLIKVHVAECDHKLL